MATEREADRVSQDTVLVPGGRDVRATLDARGGDACVVACPPHPQHGGSRTNPCLRAVSDALGGGARPIDCLRFDYGPWDEGRGERADARNAVAWARERYDRVGLFGYSFGSAVALCEASEGLSVAAVSALAPPPGLTEHLDALGAMETLAERSADGTAETPAVQVVYGERDDTVDWEPVVDVAREAGFKVDAVPGDHFFAGQAPKVGETVAAFLRERV